MDLFLIFYILGSVNIVRGLFYDELMSDCHGLPFQCMMNKLSGSKFNIRPTSGSVYDAHLFQSLNQQQESVLNNNGQNINDKFVPGGLGINPADMSAVLKKQGNTDGPFTIKSSMNKSPFTVASSGGGRNSGGNPFGSVGGGNIFKVNTYGSAKTTGSGSSSMLSNCVKDWRNCPQQCVKTNPILGCIICTCLSGDNGKGQSSNINDNDQNSGTSNYGNENGSYHKQDPYTQHTNVPNSKKANDLKESKCTPLPDTCPGECVEFNQIGCLICGCEPEPEICPHFPDCPRSYVTVDNQGCPVCTFQRAQIKDDGSGNNMDWYRRIWNKRFIAS